MYKRCYVAVGNGFAQAVPYAMFQSGQIGEMPISRSTRVNASVSEVNASPNAVLVTAAQLAGNGNGGGSNTIVAAESQSGELALVRREYQDGTVGAPMTISIGFANTSGGTAYPIIGDGNTIAVASGRWAALPGSGFTISGTYGTSTLAMLRTFSANSPIKITNIQLNFSAIGFLSAGSVLAAETTLDGSVNTKNLNLQTWLQPDNFQTLVTNIPQPADNPFRMILDPFTSLIIGVPNSYTVTATLAVQSVSKAHDMKRV